MILQFISFACFAAGVFFYTIKELQSFGKLKWQKGDDSFWGENSHYRKYANPLDAPKDNWYYRFFKIGYKERSPGSATIFVMFTDGAHLCQTLFKLLFCISIVTYSMDFSWWMALVYFVIWGVVFTITYKILSR